MMEYKDPELISSPQPHQNYSIYRAVIDEKDQKTSRTYLLQLKKEPQQDGQEGWRYGVVKTHTPQGATQKENNYNFRGSSQGVWGPNPKLGSPTWGPYMGKMNHQNFCLCRPVGLTFGRARRLWELETPLLKSTHKISYTLEPRAGPRTEAIN